MEIKKTIKYDGNLKNVSIRNGVLIDEDGVQVDLMKTLANVYGDKTFNISTNTKTEQLIDADDFHNGNDSYEDEDEEDSDEE